MRFGVALILSLLLAGCGGKGGTSSATPSAITNALLLEHNASANGGVTTRWSFLPITVETGDFADAEAQFNRWRDATGGAVTFAFGGSSAGVRVQMGGPLPDTCAETIVFFTSAGSITQAQTTLTPIWDTPACKDTITHEAGHVIGFLGHTSDGGLMDPDGGNGQITGPVADMIRTLYSNPPGTIVKASLLARGASAPTSSLQSVRFVTPVRRP